VLDEAARTGVKILAGGQTQGTSPLIQTVRKMILSAEMGRLTAMAFWAYTGWMLNPREAQEVDDSQGGGIVWRQMPHQIEAVRWLGGGVVRSVRASAGRWRPERPNGTGYAAAYLEMEDGTPVTLTYNAYGYFDTSELIEWGQNRGIEGRQARRKQLLAGQLDEPKGKEATRFGGLVAGKDGPRIPWEDGTGIGGGGGPRTNAPSNQGVFVLSFERGSVRMSPDGLYVYDDEGKREVKVARAEGQGMAFLDSEPLELLNGVRSGTPILHDGRWGMATAEVQWAILESAKRREEVVLSHQAPVPAGF
jgi:phthalate 4,5-cis-dihydrodiol dehydrogenase